MYLVLCNSSDLAAMWAYLQLKKELGASIDIVTAEVLASALRWEHRVTTNGTSTTIALADGRVIRSDEIRATLNRIEHIAPIPPQAGVDRDYAAAEMHALFASWIYALPGRVWNRATPAGLCGSTWRQSTEWMQLAARAGFKVERQALSLSNPVSGGLRARRSTLLVAGESVVGAAPPSVKSSALALARATGASILGVELTHDSLFRSATPRPDLRAGGAQIVDALRSQLFAEAA